MRGWEDKTGWDPAGAEQEPPPPPLDPSPAHFKDPSHSRCLAGIPQLPKGKGLGAGLGLVRAAGGRDIDHSSLHSWRSQVAARTIFSSPGGGRGAAGRDEIELVGGERERAGALEPEQLSLCQCVQGVWGVWGGAASSRSLRGLSEAQVKRCFPVGQKALTQLPSSAPHTPVWPCLLR